MLEIYSSCFWCVIAVVVVLSDLIGKQATMLEYYTAEN